MFIMSRCGIAHCAALLSDDILKKTYFHFWGTDFYGLRTSVIHDGKSHLKWVIHKILTKYSFKNASALVFLIDGEYEKFVKITRVENRHLIAPMPDDPMKCVIYSRRAFERKATRNS